MNEILAYDVPIKFMKVIKNKSIDKFEFVGGIIYVWNAIQLVRIKNWRNTMNYNIRKINDNEYKFLDNFLYEAIYVPEGVKHPPKTIINNQELQVYVSGFGEKKDDICFVVEIEGIVGGAVWARVMNDYGHIADGIPSLAISLYEQYRGYGIGTALMKRMIVDLEEKGYEKTSLAVQKANYAVKMYKNVGFEIVDQNEEEYIMVCQLK